MRASFLLVVMTAMVAALVSGCSYDTDGEPYPVDTDTGADSGIGTECSDDTDCAGLEADLCALNPMDTEEPGYCTLVDCEPGECPGDYQCCDCEEVDPIYVIFCTHPDQVSLVEMAGCSCS
jgi:hypothetical protein